DQAAIVDEILSRRCDLALAYDLDALRAPPDHVHADARLGDALARRDFAVRSALCHEAFTDDAFAADGHGGLRHAPERSRETLHLVIREAALRASPRDPEFVELGDQVFGRDAPFLRQFVDPLAHAESASRERYQLNREM